MAALRRDFASARRRIARLVPESGARPPSADWTSWNAAIDAATTIADRIAKEPAVTLDNLVLKLAVLRWWCEQNAAFADLEGHRRLEAFQRDLRRLARQE